ncbi:heat shock protein GrpE [Poriferisphaera corsica]|uniref:Protein GrpE n=1 Tax=Poriferisphaera corsica TaxID=2528020 RepID=A0A517YSR4_9BACT|nr:nucleotide exchange factor GrpE [Poriferisphaera corsica]QDU33279.1 heat shock protein GrpE [Poriferisphaera corsica]
MSHEDINNMEEPQDDNFKFEGNDNPEEQFDTEAEGEIELTEEDKLRKQLQELNDKYLRTAADYQNYVRRAEQNVGVVKEQQVMSIARELVTVLDHFDRAVEVDKEKVTVDDLLGGVKIVKDELLRSIGKFGVQRVEAQVGEEFDPNKHEAMMRQPSEEVETNHIVQQFQPGYVINDKTIRPAGVIVAQ